MNCFSALRIPRRSGLKVRVLAACALGLAACGASVSEGTAVATEREYRIDYRATPRPSAGEVVLRLELRQERYLLREMSFSAERITKYSGDGSVEIADGELRWLPPRDGGTLSWTVDVAHARPGGGYDAYLGSDWGLFRAEDIIPRAATRTLKGAFAETTLSFDLPRGWSVVTEYRESDNRFRIARPGRRFGQPAGWIVIGKLGVRRDRIAGVRVAVAAPEDQGARRLDMIALLNWTLPELARIVPELPSRLTIVSAGDPMWRGGLSAPQSIYIHAERPLLSENGTSTLLHEVAHVALGLDVAAGYDWIVEGLAEYYALELLGRSGTLSDDRFAAAIDWQRDWAATATTLCAPSASGATTALAVVRFAALDREIRQTSAGEASLDDVVRRLVAETQPVDDEALRVATMAVTGRKPDALHIDHLPGCRKLPAVDQGLLTLWMTSL